MSAGKSGGKQSGTNTSAPDPALSAFTDQLRKQAEPIGDVLSQQMLEALKTGGVGAYLPIAQSSVEQSRAATSNTMRSIQDQLVRMGLDRSPYGANILAGAQEQGSLSAESIYPDIVSALISAAPGFATGTGGLIVNALRPFGTQTAEMKQRNWQGGFDLGSGSSQAASGAAIAALFTT